MSRPELQNQPPDPSEPFGRQTSHFFIPVGMPGFDAAKGTGDIQWKPMSLRSGSPTTRRRTSWTNTSYGRTRPEHEYEDERIFPFKLSFVSPRTARLRLAARPTSFDEGPSQMLEHLDGQGSWGSSGTDGSVSLRTSCAELIVQREPFGVELRDARTGSRTRPASSTSTRCRCRSSGQPRISSATSRPAWR
jgi:alpha-D-xyloside xylohydrolase